MRKLVILALCLALVSCSDSTGPDPEPVVNQPRMTLPDPYDWVPIIRFDGSAASYCYPDEPLPENNNRCVTTFNEDAPVFYEGQWCSSNSYKLAFWVWYGWQQECIIGQGDHGNDWEHVVLNFNYKSQDVFELESVTFSQHSGWYTRGQTSGPVNVWVGKIAHGSYHSRCDGTGFLWEVTYCQGGCGYWDDFRNDTHGIQWQPNNLLPVSESGPLGDRIKSKDYCGMWPCKGSSDRILGTAGCWQNNHHLWPKSSETSSYDVPLLYECSADMLYSCAANSKAITSIYSVHNNDREDRVWTFGSTELPGGPSTCEWTDYLNGWDAVLDYTAPDGYFISGFASVHNNDREDRVWKVKICKQRGKCTTEGQWTDYINGWDAALDLQTEGKVICGISSYHNNDREDRRWKFLLCDLLDCK